jgi:DNA-binding CsgD family transcriptional regulator
MSRSAGRPPLVGRRHECSTLSGLIAAAKAGRSQVLVLRGGAGMGKTALLEFLIDRAIGCSVMRASGIESEMELPFASLHQLCGPYLDQLHKLPRAQRDVLGTAFGLRAGRAPDIYQVGLAVLTLMSEVFEERAVVCVIDDAHWLDKASAAVLEVVARRLVAESIAMVFAVRDTVDPPALTGLRELLITGLPRDDATRLLTAAVAGPLDPRVRDRIVAESDGNPLALLELPRAVSAAELAFGGSVNPVPTLLAERLERGFLRRVSLLPLPSRRLLLAAAAEPVGDVVLLERAAERLGVALEAVADAETEGLIEFGTRVRFRHPLVRSVAYRSATPAERRAVHRALADATDVHTDPDRRAWHLAQSVVGPDEVVALELERSAARAVAHGGLAAAAALLERAASLTPDPVLHVRRCLDAAQAKVHAGQFDDALALAAMAEAGPTDEFSEARIDLLRAQVSFAANRGNDGLPLLLTAARRLEPLDARLARDTYLDALSAALFAGRLATGPSARDVARAARSAPSVAAPRKGDALLAALAVLFTEGYTAAAPTSREAVQAFARGDLDLDEGLRFSWLAASTAVSLWDDVSWDVLTRRHLDIARQVGALAALPLALTSRLIVDLFKGDLVAASALAEENRSVTELMHGVVSLAPYGELCLAAARGQQQAEPLLSRFLEDVTARGEGVGVNMIEWARSLLCNGRGRFREALSAAKAATADPLELGPPKWALSELVEAGVRSGDVGTATGAAEQLAEMTEASGTDWALGIRASRLALLRRGSVADELHREGVNRLGRTGLRLELARAQLLYGEWLRREGRRSEARNQLRDAYEALSAMGAEAFAERARRELLATGVTARRRNVLRPVSLTPQEAHIARMAADGLSNAEIGTSMYISARTAEWHVGNIMRKLGVSSRRHLRAVLAPERSDAVGS